jgi:hypothetical protein
VDPQTLQLLDNLRLRNTAVSGQIRDRVDGFVTARWRTLDSWRDDDVQRLLDDILPVLDAAQRQMADATASYLATVDSVTTGSAFRLATVPYADVTGTALRGVDPRVLFQRPQMVMNYALSRGASLTAAVGAGEDRLRSLAGTNLQLAKTKTTAKVGKPPFYRRVLTGKENCSLCVVASTQRYRRGDLARIHPGCDCGIEPIIDGQAPHVIDQSLLDSTYAEIAKKLGVSDVSWSGLHQEGLVDFRALTISRTNGELGPVLAWRGDRFRGPDSVGKDSRPASPAEKARAVATRWEAMKSTSEKTIRALESARDAGQDTVDLTGSGNVTRVRDFAQAIDYHRSLIARADREIAGALAAA